jgi:3D (Asp-Asp-Asp) domain-containing protein
MHAARYTARRPAELATLAALGAFALVMSACAAVRPPPVVASRVPVPAPTPRSAPDAGAAQHTREVLASAYNSLAQHTDPHPTLAAWGDRLEPGMRAIAVSRDLLEVGLTRGARVWIDGLEGEYVVLDKMAKRWSNKIDIYMGEDVQAARRWGVREVRIRWSPPGH